jgi:hypothetical protein
MPQVDLAIQFKYRQIVFARIVMSPDCSLSKSTRYEPPVITTLDCSSNARGAQGSTSKSNAAKDLESLTAMTRKSLSSERWKTNRSMKTLRSGAELEMSWSWVEACCATFSAVNSCSQVGHFSRASS